MGWEAAVGALISLAGTATSMEGASESRSAMNKATEAELQRQGVYKKRGEEVANQSVQLEAPKAAQQNIDTGTKQTADAYRVAQDMAPTSAATITPTSSVVDTARKAATSQSNAARSLLSGGYGNFNLQNWLTQKNAGDKLEVLSNESQASNSVLPIELQSAQHKGDGMSTIGSIMSTLGSLVGMYGATAGAGAAAAAPTAAQSSALSAGFGPVSAGYGQVLQPLTSMPWYSAFPNLMKTLQTQ